jgi:hypothetical protein
MPTIRVPFGPALNPSRQGMLDATRLRADSAETDSWEGCNDADDVER